MFDWASSFTPDDAARLRRVEHLLSLILDHLGVAHAAGEGELPEPVRLLAVQGDVTGAIKEYRKLTGADLGESVRAVDGYVLRHSAGTAVANDGLSSGDT